MTTTDAAPELAPRAGLSAGVRGRILIVDDRPDRLLALEVALAPLAHEIIKAASGEEALRALLRLEFAVVLLDVSMPRMDGFETARLIRGRRRNRDTPIIFITSYGDEIQAVQGYAVGAVDYIPSPFLPEVLRSKVSVFLQLYERTAQVEEHTRQWIRRTRQSQAVTQASLAIHGAPSIRQTLQMTADSAREIIGAEWAAIVVMADPNGLRNKLVVSPNERGQVFLDYSPEPELQDFIRGLSHVVRLGAAELASSAVGRLIPATAPAAGGLVAPLLGRESERKGLLLVGGKRDGDVNDDDEVLLMQLSRMAMTAVGNFLFAKVQESNRIKDEFLATLSHELRTPLSSILGWAQLLRTQMLDADETAEALEIIEKNAQIQCKLIEDLLDVSRIVSGKLKLNVRRIDVAPIVQEAVNVVLPAARARQVSISVRVAPNPRPIEGDADRLQQVLWNVLSNAVKFTPAGGHVNVSHEDDAPWNRIIVSDNGEGIAPEFLPSIFDRFRQADSSASRKHGGLGIGLAIVRHVVELHGGTVRAESAGKGLGTSIIINLPVAIDGAASPAPHSGNGAERASQAGSARELLPAIPDGQAGLS